MPARQEFRSLLGRAKACRDWDAVTHLRPERGATRLPQSPPLKPLDSISKLHSTGVISRFQLNYMLWGAVVVESRPTPAPLIIGGIGEIRGNILQITWKIMGIISIRKIRKIVVIRNMKESNMKNQRGMRTQAFYHPDPP